MGLAPEHLEVIENLVTTSPTAGAFPMLGMVLVLGPKVALRHLLYFYALYLWVYSYCLINADDHEARLWPGKGRPADSAEALQRLHHWKGGRPQRRAEEQRPPEDTRRGVETGKAPAGPNKQHHSRGPATDVAG